ncbi:adenylate/guanylate cyclase domain-containing protein [Bradyrhizobium sp. Tv2a-2]|uniref:adenylate/guanylate cyclase domain-containing protein n=1 Tax=Bradyrhizobium sp. Tv2a-2 TaxID=113395 RepID=UPI000426F0AF|nr:adenylate/guanylate cyclase domain-containing protein [Bradyrhizobium sp. Tv2a-2]
MPIDTRRYPKLEAQNPTARVERRLAAVLAADLAGYGRLMGEDEEGTLARLMACRQACFDPKISEYRGRIVKTTGDGLLVDFSSAVEAVRCAIEIQQLVAESNLGVPEDRRLRFRIGIHVGDILIDDHDMFGDGVNIAARLEGIAEPGGVCISDDAYRQIRGKVEITYDDMGPQALKNIAEPVRVWRARADSGEASARKSDAGDAASHSDRPSIAVLPFQNISDDARQDCLADGIVEDILTELARFRPSLSVAARNSSFVYKGRAVDIKRVGQELGVRYVLEGSVRKSGKRVRVTGQLIDALTGSHVWAEHFDVDEGATFDRQDEITRSVVGALASALERAATERARQKPSATQAAYDHFLLGMADIYEGTRESSARALERFTNATRMDPGLSVAYAMSCYCYVWRKASGWPSDPADVEIVRRLARKATKTGADDAFALSEAGFALAAFVGDLDEGLFLIDQALSLNPNMAVAWRFSGYVNAFLGQTDLAVEHLNRAIQLNPRDPLIFIPLNGLAIVHYFAEQYETALRFAQRATRQNPDYPAAQIMVAVSAAMAGRERETAAAVQRLLQLDPSYRFESFRDIWLVRRAEDRAAFEAGLRLTGLPA